MTKRQLKCINLMVTTNLTQKEIAVKIGTDETTVSRWKKKPEFIEALEKYQAKFLNSMTSEAMRTLKSLLMAENENVRLSAAKDILDRNGYKPADKQEIKLDGDIGLNERLNRYKEYLEDDN